jgi:atlastin
MRRVGEPLPIVNVTKENEFELNEGNLQTIFSKALDKKVCVVSVAGASRKGKSFLSNFFLRYLSHNNRNDWIGDDNESLTGFHWRGGTEPDTTGIIAWSEPFFMKLNNKDEEVFKT